MKIHLGFEVDTGEPVSIPLGHTVVTGQTQRSGKTTTLEALISRSGLRAVSFVTKRGEGSFGSGRHISPYFRERADWQFVESVLESVMRQKMRFERSWIVRASKGATTLEGVQANIRRFSKTAKGIHADVYLLLEEYLNLVIPLIQTLPYVNRVDLAPGVNVMDLSAYPSQLQALVIRSVLEWVYEREMDVLTVIPEAWEFIPRSRNSPVKLAAAQLARKGAALRNFILLDSQDIVGVDYEILKQVSVWILGVQREINEVKRSLAHIPAGVKKPKPEMITSLRKGQFYVCFDDDHGMRVVKVYVQPYWLDDHAARLISIGEKSIESAKDNIQEIAAMTKPANPSLEEAIAAGVRAALQAMPTPQSPPPAVAAPPALSPATNEEEALYQRFKARLIKESPHILRVLATQPELEVVVEKQVIQIDGASLRGRLARLLADGWFDEPKTGQATFNELERKGAAIAKPSVYKECDKLADMGFLTVEGKAGYLAVKEAKINILKK